MFARDANVIVDNNILDFEDEEITNARVSYTPQAPEYVNNMAWANTETGGINSTFTCAYFKGNTKTPQWWHGFYFEFKSPVNASENKYLHIMMRKSVLETQKVQISLMNLTGVQSNPLVDEPITTEWVDYVMEIPETHAIFNGVYVKFNAQSPATECFVDEIFMNNDPEPRSVGSSINEVEKGAVMVTVENGIVSVENMECEISVSNMMGQCVYKGMAPSVPLQKGVYIVNIGSIAQKIFVK